MTVILDAPMRPESPLIVQLGDEAKVSEIVNSPEWKVREEHFSTSVEFQVGELRLSRNRVPLIDFALSLRSALDAALVNGVCELQIQGSSDRMRFNLVGDQIEVRANYVQGTATCSFASIYRAVILFARNFLDVVTEAAPELLKNVFIEYLYRTYAVREMGERQFQRHSRVIADIHRRRLDG